MAGKSIRSELHAIPPEFVACPASEQPPPLPSSVRGPGVGITAGFVGTQTLGTPEQVNPFST